MSPFVSSAIRALSWGYLTVSRRSIQQRPVWYIAVAADICTRWHARCSLNARQTHQPNAALFHKKIFFFFFIIWFFFLSFSFDQFLFISIQPVCWADLHFQDQRGRERDVFIYLGRGRKIKQTGNYFKCSRICGCNSIFVCSSRVFKIFFYDLRIQDFIFDSSGFILYVMQLTHFTFVGYAKLIALVFQTLLLLVPKIEQLQLHCALDPIASSSPDACDGALFFKFYWKQ